ncbi:MAG: flagellar FlbD family protein [bacterium]|nr:flagellar FlbD family protein [bacterium]
MVTLTKLNGKSVMINTDLVEMVEETPDCLITMTTGRKLMVKESLQVVKERLQTFRRSLRGAYPVPAGGEDYDPVDVVVVDEERSREG